MSIWFLNLQQHPATASAVLLIVGVILGYLARGLLSHYRQQTHYRAKTEKAKRAIVKRERALCQERINLLDNLSQTLVTTLNYQRVLDLTLDAALKSLTTQDNTGAIPMLAAVMLFDNKGKLRVASARRFTPGDMRVSLPARSGALARVIKHRHPTIVNNPSTDAELRAIIALNAAKTAYIYPLVSGVDIYGVLLFAHPNPKYFNDERVDLLEFLGKQATIAIQNARLYDELEREKERLTEVEAEARKKLARDLHDGPTQTIAAIAMRVDFIRRLIQKDPDAAIAELEKIEKLARHTTKEIRHLLFTLRPLVLETEGLDAALQAMADKFRQVYNQNVLVEIDPRVVERLDSTQQTTTFTIAEEAVNNARKHAQAKHIWVRLKLIRSDIALLEVQDDGVGFNVGSVTSNYGHRGSLGMVNIRERAELVNGYVELHSHKGEGTLIRLWIPLSSDAAERLRQGHING